MPDLNKQTLINLLIDSPLREPIKINLIDIVNNTNDVDLPKTFSTISKELEIFQKATERRMKLADETIAKLSGTGPAATTPATSPAPMPATTETVADAGPAPALPPLPPLPTAPVTPPTSDGAAPVATDSLAVPPLDLPPMPTSYGSTAPVAPVQAVPTAPVTTPPETSTAPASATDEDALKEIQKELDALKTAATEDSASATTPQA